MRAHFAPAFLIGALAFLPYASGQGQTKPPSLSIGGHEVAIGMPADQAIAGLRASFKVEPGGELPFRKGSRSWAISPRDGGAPFGYLNAAENSVIGAEYRLFAKKIESAQDLFDALSEASAMLEQQHRNKCVVRVANDFSPAGQIRSGLLVSCEDYQVRVLRIPPKSAGDGPPTFEVWEGLGTVE